MCERGERDAWSVVCDVVCGKDEGVNGAREGGGERIRKGGEVRDPNLQALSLENHQDGLHLPSHFKTNTNGTV